MKSLRQQVLHFTLSIALLLTLLWQCVCIWSILAFAHYRIRMPLPSSWKKWRRKFDWKYTSTATNNRERYSSSLQNELAFRYLKILIFFLPSVYSKHSWEINKTYKWPVKKSWTNNSKWDVEPSLTICWCKIKRIPHKAKIQVFKNTMSYGWRVTEATWLWSACLAFPSGWCLC